VACVSGFHFAYFVQIWWGKRALSSTDFEVEPKKPNLVFDFQQILILG